MNADKVLLDGVEMEYSLRTFDYMLYHLMSKNKKIKVMAFAGMLVSM